MANISKQAQRGAHNLNTSNQPVDHQDEDASLDSELKAIWDAEIGSPKRKPVLYREAAALLISWDDNTDDLKTGEEVERLQTLLKETFHYETVRGVLHQKLHPTPQIQINQHLANFVAKYDKPNSLLIVYYAGHGRPGEPKDGLTLAGRQDLKPTHDASSHEIIWSSTEHNIRHATSDILVIFDCCHAAQLEKNVRSTKHRRAYEYLAATSAMSTTPRPGPRSFTTAMIWAMKALVEAGEIFTTQKLIHTIINDAPDFPGDQFPRLSDGVTSCPRKITLAPLNIDSKPQSPSIETQEEEDGGTTDLNLRFVFNTPTINKTIVSQLAREISNCLNSDELKGSMVVWEGLNSRPLNHNESHFLLPYYANRWRKQVHKRKNGQSPTKSDSLGENLVNEKNKNCKLLTPEWENVSSVRRTRVSHKRSASEAGLRTPVSGSSSTDGMSDSPTNRTRSQKRIKAL